MYTVEPLIWLFICTIFGGSVPANLVRLLRVSNKGGAYSIPKSKRSRLYLLYTTAQLILYTYMRILRPHMSATALMIPSDVDRGVAGQFSGCGMRHIL